MAAWLSKEEQHYFSVRRAYKGSAWGRDSPPNADVRGVQAPGVGGPGKTPLIWGASVLGTGLAAPTTAVCQAQPRAEPIMALPSGFRLS